MAHYLIGEKKKFSYDEFKTMKYNRSFNDSLYSHGFDNASVMFNLDASKYPDLADAIAVLKSWNKSSDPDNKQAALIISSMYPLIDKITARGTNYESNFFTEKEFVQALRAGKKHMLKHFGSLTAPLGEVQKHARANVELPMGGMPEVLAATYSQPYKNGKRRTYVGESYIQLVKFSKDEVEIETVNAYGSSSKPDSPHYTDQMQMFVNQQLKPMTLQRAAILHSAEEVYYPGQRQIKEKAIGHTSVE